MLGRTGALKSENPLLEPEVIFPNLPKQAYKTRNTQIVLFYRTVNFTSLFRINHSLKEITNFTISYLTAKKWANCLSYADGDSSSTQQWNFKMNCPLYSSKRNIEDGEETRRPEALIWLKGINLLNSVWGIPKGWDPFYSSHFPQLVQIPSTGGMVGQRRSLFDRLTTWSKGRR